VFPEVARVIEIEGCENIIAGGLETAFGHPRINRLRTNVRGRERSQYGKGDCKSAQRDGGAYHTLPVHHCTVHVLI
jgi:hypothetical protein